MSSLSGLSKINGGTRYFRPNLDRINRLRQEVPIVQPIDSKMRPQELKLFVFIDDKKNIVRTATEFLMDHINTELGIEAEIISGDFSLLPDNRPLIVSASSEKEITSMYNSLASLRPDMVFTDFNLGAAPWGNQIIHKARTEGFKGFCIGLTGRPDNIRPFYEAGADLVIDKPFSFRDIAKLFL